MAEAQTSDRFDQWLSDSGPAAVTRRSYLEPIEGPDAVIFPPTYPIDGQDKAGYNIDEVTVTDGPDNQQRTINVAQIDSVGSQANRLEPLFIHNPDDPEQNKDRWPLVPQVVIEAGEHKVNLLEAGHRVADAVVRCSSLGEKISEAMEAMKKGNATPIAKLAPTSLVFGFWDSRETQVKMPRVIRSVIRAYDVEQLTRSAQYSTTAGVILDGENVEVTTKGKKAERGFAHVPSTQTHGGILVNGEIRRDAILNLAALRSLHGPDADSTTKLRRYILGLALVAFTANQETALREGCELIPALDEAGQPKASTHLVGADGQRESFELSEATALAYAQDAANAFGVGEGGTFAFDKEKATKELK
jgi:CRISPR-associated protein Csb1